MHNSPVLQFRQLVFFLLLYPAWSGLAEAQATKQQVDLIADWQVISSKALGNNLPIVLLVEISDCRFCEIVKKEFINPLAISQRYQDKVIFSRISLDPGQTIIDSDRSRTDTVSFCARYEARFTPTIVFLDGEGNQLIKNLVGMSGRDYYGYYLEQGIEESIKVLQLTN